MLRVIPEMVDQQKKKKKKIADIACNISEFAVLWYDSDVLTIFSFDSLDSVFGFNYGCRVDFYFGVK